MDASLWAQDSERLLMDELRATAPAAGVVSRHGLIWCELTPELDSVRPLLAFSRQFLPNSHEISAASISAWARLLCDAILETLPATNRWHLHVEPHYGHGHSRSFSGGARALHSALRNAPQTHFKAGQLSFASPGAGSGIKQNTAHHQGAQASAELSHPRSHAGRHRCDLILSCLREILHERRRKLLRNLAPSPAPFDEGDSLVQLLLTSPESGVLSVAPAPIPFLNRHLVSPFPQGQVPVARDTDAPSRAFAKLIEAEQRLGFSIQPREHCVDLGASPGSWTYVAAKRGARVLAIDRAPLRADLMNNALVEFRSGDAFSYRPEQPVAWLLCDVIAEPERLSELLVRWLQNKWCRCFVVTVKLKLADPQEALKVLAQLKAALPGLCKELRLTKLDANKHEICAFGIVRQA